MWSRAGQHLRLPSGGEPQWAALKPAAARKRPPFCWQRCHASECFLCQHTSKLAQTNSQHSTHVPCLVLALPWSLLPLSALATALIPTLLPYWFQEQHVLLCWSDACISIMQCSTQLVMVMLLGPWMPCTPKYLTAG